MQISNQLNDTEVSKYMNIVKFFAILSVILAHSRNTYFGFLSNVTERLGTLGVICFLFVSGYYFKTDSNIATFFRKKSSTILLPWLISGVIVYFVSRKTLDLLGLAQWLIGFYTYLYYLTILFICFFVFHFIKTKDTLVLLIFVTAISILSTYFGLWESLLFYPKNFPPYLNILNWIGFFALGILCKNNFNRWYFYLKKYRIMIIILFIALLLIFAGINIDKKHGYFSLLAFPMEILGMMSILSLSTFKIFDNNMVKYISKISFTIYLYHFLSFPFRKFIPKIAVMDFIKPIYFCFITTSAIYLVLVLAKKNNLGKIANRILGIRNY